MTGENLDIGCHFVRSKVQAGIAHLMSITFKNQLVDMVTKPLHSLEFKKQLERLGMISIH